MHGGKCRVITREKLKVLQRMSKIHVCLDRQMNLIVFINHNLPLPYEDINENATWPSLNF